MMESAIFVKLNSNLIITCCYSMRGFGGCGSNVSGGGGCFGLLLHPLIFCCTGGRI